MYEKDKEGKVHPGNGITITLDGKFNLNSLYETIKNWFGEMRYDYSEKESQEKNFPEGNFILMKLNGDREVDDFVKFSIEVELQVLRLNKTESGNTGDLRIKMRGFYTLDYKENWKSLSFLFHIYKKIILKKKIDEFYEPKIYDELMDLNSKVKSVLGLKK